MSTSGNALDIAVTGSVGFVVVKNFGLRGLDVKNPTEPVMLTMLPIPNALAVSIQGNLAFVTGGSSGLYVANVADPAYPVILGTMDTPGSALQCAVAGLYAYIADGAAGLQIADISNPVAPVIVGTVNTGNYARGVAVSGQYAFVASSQAGLEVIDVTDPTDPVLVGTMDTPAIAASVAVVSTHCYVLDRSIPRSVNAPGVLSSLQVVDVSNVSSPVTVGATTLGPSATNVTVAGGFAYVADAGLGLRVVDISDPAEPEVIGDCGRMANAVAVNGGFAYVAEPGLVSVFDLANPASPATGQLFTGGSGGLSILDVAAQGNYAYVTGYTDLEIIDVTDPLRPALMGSVSMQSAHGLAVSGDRAYVTNTDGSFTVVDISNAASPAILGSVSWEESQARGVAVDGRYAYVANIGLGLRIVDVAEPASPVLIKTVDTPGLAQDVALTLHYAVIADDFHGLAIVDVANPDAAAIVSSLDLPEPGAPTTGVAVSGGIAYLSDDSGVLHLVDISDPANPVQVSYLVLPGGTSRGVAVRGDWAYVTDEFYGVVVVDVSEPLSPALVGQSDFDGLNVAVTESGVYATFLYKTLAPTTEHGLRVLPLQCDDLVIPVREPISRQATMLGQNYPNPFNPVTIIPFVLALKAHATMDIYDVQGRHVRRLIDDVLPAGPRQVTWDGRNASREEVSSGVYFCVLQAANELISRKIVLLK